MTCTHLNVMPILPVHFEGWKTSIDGICLGCGESGFAIWEAYSYADAFYQRDEPTDEEVLAELDEWWELPTPLRMRCRHIERIEQEMR